MGIAAGLAGKRIAVTGAHRLPRHRPGRAPAALRRPAASSSCSSGPAGARPSTSGPTGRSSATTPSTGSAPSSASDGFDADGRPTGSPPVAGDVGTDGLGLDDDGRAAARRAATSSSTPPPPSRFDSPLDARRRGQPARPHPHRRRRSTTSASRPTSSPCPPATSPATAAARPPRSWSSESRFFIDVDWRGEVDAARRLRADAEAASRTPEQLADFRKQARQRARAPPACPLLAEKTEQLREPLGHRPHGRGRPGPGRLARLARRLRLHQGARRAGPAARPGATCPVSIVRPSIIESALAEPRPGLDPRLPHGRAGHHLLRPRPAEGVPRRARGHRRRDPRRPRRRRHHRRRRHRPARGRVRRRHPGGVRLGQPAALPPASSTCPRAGSPSTRSTTARASRSSCRRLVVPRPGPGRRASSGGPRRRSSGPSASCRPCPCGASRPSGRPRLEEQARGGRAGPRLRRALRRLRRVRGGLRRRPPARPLGRPRRRRPGDLLLRPPRHRLGPLRAPTSTCRRSSSTPGCAPTPGGRTAANREDRLRAPGPRPPTGTSPPSTSRTRSSPRTSSRRTPGWPPAACRRRTGPASSPRRCAEAPALLALDRRDRSDFLRHFYRRYEDAAGRPARRGRRRDVQRPDPDQVVPRRHPPGARAPARSATAPCSSPAPSTSSSSRSGRCSTTSSAPRWRQRRRPLHAAS